MLKVLVPPRRNMDSSELHVQSTQNSQNNTGRFVPHHETRDDCLLALLSVFARMAFTTPDQSPEEQYALAACLAVLATVMVALRFYAVKTRKNQLSHDDWWILVALVGAWAIAIVNIVSAAIGGLGRHTALDEHGVPIMNSRYIVFLKVCVQT